jgi:uncharacterized RDD family membrane protein YckC
VPGVGYQPVPRYAGWGQRLGATILDGLIAIPFYVPGAVAIAAGPKHVVFRTDGFEGAGLYEEPTGGTVALAVLLYLAGAIVYVTWYCRRVGRTGQSVGMKAAGYQIVDAQSRSNIGTGRAVGRYFAKILSALPCYLGFLWPLWDSENRTFHDMLVGTRAVRD